MWIILLCLALRSDAVACIERYESAEDYVHLLGRHRTPCGRWMEEFNIMVDEYAFEPATTHFVMAPRGDGADHTYVMEYLHSHLWNASLVRVLVTRAYRAEDMYECQCIASTDDPDDNASNYRSVVHYERYSKFTAAMYDCGGVNYDGGGGGGWYINVIKIVIPALPAPLKRV